MELTGLLLLVLLPPEDATGETAVGIRASLRQEFGEVAMAVAPDTLVTPAMLRGKKAQMRARFVARLAWEQKNRARLELLAVPARTGGPENKRSRWLTFAPQDSDSERGRAIGLVLAEMMREWPSSAWTDTPTAVNVPVPAPVAFPHFELGALFATERVAGGSWAMGPRVTYAYGLSEALWLGASGTPLFASQYNYIQVGFGLGATWRFLRWEGGRHALGIGVEADLMRESATTTANGGGHVSGWYGAAGANLVAIISVGRFLRVAGQVNWRATSGTMTLVSGGGYGRPEISFSRWRPGLALGLEVAF